MNINRGYLNLKDRYLFSTISQKVREYRAQHQGREIISLGIGDVTPPWPQLWLRPCSRQLPRWDGQRPPGIRQRSRVIF